MISKVAVFGFALLLGSVAVAAPCTLMTTRYACPGAEKESYAKCNGLQTCDATVETASAAECTALAMKACENARTQVTKYKVVTAKFNGAALAAGVDFCDKDSGSYSVSKNFPYRNSPSCN